MRSVAAGLLEAAELRSLLAGLVAFLLPSLAAAGIVGPGVGVEKPGFGLQPRPEGVKVCFVGDALRSRPDRVKEVVEAFSRVEAVANIRFVGFGTCQGITKGSCIDESGASVPCEMFPEDIRIAIDWTSLKGARVDRMIPESYSKCVDRGAGSSWSHFPDVVDRPGYRACPWNLVIGDDADESQSPPRRWLDHPLHEIGHAMGLHHEFLREEYAGIDGPNGAPCETSLPPKRGRINHALFSPVSTVDIWSVMMYQDNSCGIPGGYGFDGFSDLDKLSLHILYPEDDRAAAFVGPLVAREGDPLDLRMTWLERGAEVRAVASKIQWQVGDWTGEEARAPGLVLNPGVYPGTLAYEDFLGRRFSSAFVVEILSSEAFDERMSAVAAALGAL